MSETGAYIGETAILKRDGKIIYGLMTKKDSRGKIEVDILRECLEHMKKNAEKEKVRQIEFQQLSLEGNETLENILERIFGETCKGEGKCR